MEGMVSAGLLRQSVDEVIETQAYKKFYPHGTSHWLGMDVHDVGEYRQSGKPLALQKDMCFTIEPGLYFQTALSDVPEGFRGLGVRIEDDILITDGPARVLTAKIPKKIEELENRR
jgi:Xaa-Pro aminopeptidase